MKNNFSNGKIRVLVYKERDGDVWYATALEFNLTIDGNDKKAVFIELDQAVRDYLKSAKEIGDISLLNQEPDPELVAMWNANIQNTVVENEKISPSYITAFAGLETLSFV
jgi:hypothetical protein